jgi:hypothetical protein
MSFFIAFGSKEKICHRDHRGGTSKAAASRPNSKVTATRDGVNPGQLRKAAAAGSLAVAFVKD